MVAAKITSKGQITIPKELRERLGLKAGDALEFVTHRDQTTLRRVMPKENPFLEFIGTDKGYFKDKKKIIAWHRELRD